MPSLSEDLPVSATTLVVRLVMAWIGGVAVACIARGRIRPAAGDTLSLTLVLMSILIAMATQIIGDNIARAFSLVGALSIVRFRTAVPATRDVAFVLGAVVIGMAAGAGQFWVFLFGLATVAAATSSSNLLSSKGSSWRRTDSAVLPNWRLTLQVGLHHSEGWGKKLEPLVSHLQLISATTIRRGGSLELIYQYAPRDGVDATQLIAALNSLPGMESVAAKQMP